MAALWVTERLEDITERLEDMTERLEDGMSMFAIQVVRLMR